MEGETLSFLVDCGLMAGAGQPYPDLTPDEIQTLSFLFLTHSHTDHTGALPWLEEQGFSGTVFASRETLSQLKASPRRAVCLERFTPPLA